MRMYGIQTIRHLYNPKSKFMASAIEQSKLDFKQALFGMKEQDLGPFPDLLMSK